MTQGDENNKQVGAPAVTKHALRMTKHWPDMIRIISRRLREHQADPTRRRAESPETTLDSAMADRTAEWLAYGFIDMLRCGLLRHPERRLRLIGRLCCGLLRCSK